MFLSISYQIMLDCWRENPVDRPTFERLRNTMKKIERNHQVRRVRTFFKSRASYSWNMVNLFSCGCHVIDRAYVRTYASTDCKGGVEETIKREGGRGVSGVSWQVHIYWTFTKWSIDSCQNRIATDQYHMTISRHMCQLIAVT